MSTSTGSGNTMSDIETIFKDAIEAFKQDIPSGFPQDYQWASFKDVQKEAARIQETQKNSRVMQNLNRIQPFLDAMNRYGVVVDVLAQSHIYMLFIWGPVKCLLKFASGHVPALNELLDCLENIGKGFPLFDKFEPLLKTEPRLGGFISKIFKDILELLATAMVVFRKHVIHQIIQTRWPTFREKIKQCIQQWDYDTKELQAAVFAEHVGQSATYHAQSERRERYLVIDLFAQKRKLNGFERKRQESIEIRKKDPNSGNWLLGHKRVRLWRSRMNNTTCAIGLTGIPGAGKSILSAILLNEVLTATRTSINTLVCANFFTYHEKNPSNTYFGFLSSILHRILLRDGSLVDYVFEKCPALLHDTESPTEDLEQLLDDLLSNFMAFFILDGVDELPITERKKIIDFSLDRIRTHNIKVWISSRPEHDIVQLLEAADKDRTVLIRIKREDTVEDIRYYTMHPSNLPITEFPISASDRKRILETIAQKSEGMFLYAKLMIHEISQQAKLEDVDEVVSELPDGLEQAYKRILERIKKSNKIAQSRATKVLEVLLATKRELRVSELWQMSTMDNTLEGLQGEDLRREQIVLEKLCGAIIETTDNGIIQFVHFTAKEYMVEKDRILNVQFALAEDTCATLCLKYLALVLQQQSEGIDGIQADVKECTLDGRYSLFFYAYEHWGSHLMDSVSSNFDFGGHGDLDKQVHLFDGVLQQYGGVIPILFRSAEILCGKWEQSPPPQSSSSDFQALRNAAIKINNALRTLVLSNSISNGDIDHRKLRAIYGQKLHKCARPDCMMFLTGFENESKLRRHESAHEWNVMCDVGECPRSRFGFRSQAQRESHIASAHPEFGRKDVDIETIPAVSCAQSHLTYPEEERMEILCEAILSGDVELAAKFLDLNLSLQGHIKGKDLLYLAVQSKSITMAKFITSKLELKKSFLEGVKSVLKFSAEDVVNAFLWAVRLDCRDIITFFLESQFVPDLATRMIAIDGNLDLELYKLVETVWSRVNVYKSQFNPNCINALVASLIINGNNQFKFIIGHNVDIDGPIHWNPPTTKHKLSGFKFSTTTHVLLHWKSPNYTKLWPITCQLFENGADVNFRLHEHKKTIFIEALQMGWHDRKELDAIDDLVGFGANLHEKVMQTSRGVLHFVARSKHPKLFSWVKYLVEEKGADIHERESGSRTLFFAVVKSGNQETVDIMKYLENKGLDLHAKFTKGRNVAFPAVSSINLATKLEVVKHLRDRHVDFTLKDTKGATVLEFYEDKCTERSFGTSRFVGHNNRLKLERIPEQEIEVILECLAAGAEPWWDSVSGDHAADLRNLKAPTWNMLKPKKIVAPDNKA